MNYWYRFIMAMSREERRTLTIGAMTSTGRDERIAWAVHALDLGAAPSPNLCSLALLSVRRIQNPRQVEDFFRRSLKEPTLVYLCGVACCLTCYDHCSGIL